MENQEKIICLTEIELNFQLMQIAEKNGLADEVSTEINKSFIQKYTTLKYIPLDLAAVIKNRYTLILEDAKTHWQAYINTLLKLMK